MNPRDHLHNFLSQFFNQEHYMSAIKAARAAIASDRQIAEQWEAAANLIRNRELEAGEALGFVHNSANQVIDENTDAEAYVWLDLVVRNIENPDGEIVDY